MPPRRRPRRQQHGRAGNRPPPAVACRVALAWWFCLPRVRRATDRWRRGELRGARWGRQHPDGKREASEPVPGGAGRCLTVALGRRQAGFMAARSRSALAGTGGEKTQPKSRASASRRQAPLLALTGVVVGTWEVGRFLHVVLG
ncbi:hypothetical protein PVAP13_4NG288638 [Panicum virgatum]|uniref:Uncharacterized protein n=1 Tax=Panicum virgatum TaxID=38727 RepID=A0A8T0TGD0_PANVG|nr:hypothetical protein PVAP13_4NG288638 [Panicum virgatum]